MHFFSFSYSVRENLVLDEVEKAGQEVGLFKAAGGGCICEMSVVGMRREAHDLADLATIATATGLHIVSATGFYSEGFLSAEVKAMSVQAMAEFMMGEIVRGCGRSEFKCGVMYVACSDPLNETERKALEAAAITHKHTGVHRFLKSGYLLYFAITNRQTTSCHFHKTLIASAALHIMKSFLHISNLSPQIRTPLTGL